MDADEEIPFYEENKEGGDSIANKLRRIITSASLLVVAYILSNFLLQILIGGVGLLLKYTIKFSYNKVTVRPLDYHFWSRTHVVMVYFFPPVICFALGLFIYNILRIRSNWSTTGRLFFFWASTCLVNMILAHALISPLGSPSDRANGLYQTFAVVGAFLWINPAIMVMMAIGSLIVSLGFGMIIRQEVLRYSFSNKLIQTKKGMDSVVVQVYIFPVMFASIPIILLSAQISFFTTVMQLANLAVISIGIFLMNSIGIAGVRCNKEDVLNHVPFVELAICSAVWLSIFMFFK
jgi:hypothetical protein